MGEFRRRMTQTRRRFASVGPALTGLSGLSGLIGSGQPSGPTGLAVQSTTASSITIGGASGGPSFDIWRGTTSGGETLLASSQTLPYTDSAASVTGTLYYFVKTHGSALQSNEVSGACATVANIPGAIIWAAASASGAVGDGNPITSTGWKDKTANSNNSVSLSTGTTQAVYHATGGPGNKPYLSFAGFGYNFPSVGVASGSWTKIGVVNITTIGTGAAIIGCFSGSTQGWRVVSGTDIKYRYSAANVWDPNPATYFTTLLSATWYLYLVEHDALTGFLNMYVGNGSSLQWIGNIADTGITFQSDLQFCDTNNAGAPLTGGATDMFYWGRLLTADEKSILANSYP